MYPITPESLSVIFGYKSEITKGFIFELYKIILDDNDKVKSGFKEWLELFQIVGGYRKEKYQDDILEMSKLFSIPSPIDCDKVLFAIHTYYSIITRWLTYRIVFKERELDDNSFNPINIYKHFKKTGINNYGFTGYFDWYYENKTGGLSECFIGLKNQFLDFDFENGFNDLFKPLYQNIFPVKVRHHLGEYYTPQWLAEMTIIKSGYNFDPEKKILDPACGSGTFIIEVLKNVIKNTEKNSKINPEIILNNVVGFDLNPLAVLSTKSNYILALQKYLPLGSIHDIPVYHFDSIICDNSFLNNKDSINSRYTKKQRSNSGYDLLPERYLKSPEFDFIVGNPPWINWKFLPEYYKNSVRPAAEKYDLFTHKGLKARLGFAQDDLCVILTYIAIDRFLKDKGILSFVLPQTLFKTIGGGEGFRRFRLGVKGKTFKVLSVSDLSDFKVFDSSASRSAIFTCQKDGETVYPLNYEIWKKKKELNIHSYNSLSDVLNRIDVVKHLAEPIKGNYSSWITAEKEILKIIKNVTKTSHYIARAGVCTWASSIYWIKIISEVSNLTNVITCNDTAKYKQKEIYAKIDSKLIFPLVRGRNIIRWHFDSDVAIILPQSEEDLSKAMNEVTLRRNYPDTYKYFLRFKQFLLNRKGYKTLLINQPFYSVYDIGPYTFNRNKVAWKYLDSDLRAVVLSKCGQDRPFIPDLNVITISTESEEEAHYLAAFLNSSIIRLIIQTYGLCTRITPGILGYLPLDKFQPDNSGHIELVKCSIECHNHWDDPEYLNERSLKIDTIVKDLLGIKDKQFNKIIESLDFYLD
jgi:hypothetical protein